jgi:hypothetical protein
MEMHRTNIRKGTFIWDTVQTGSSGNTFDPDSNAPLKFFSVSPNKCLKCVLNWATTAAFETLSLLVIYQLQPR